MKKLNKVSILLLAILAIILPQNNFIATTIATNNNDSGIITHSDGIEWRYKLINGKLYKRQYNVTTKKWIGNWIPA